MDFINFNMVKQAQIKQFYPPIAVFVILWSYVMTYISQTSRVKRGEEDINSSSGEGAQSNVILLTFLCN